MKLILLGAFGLGEGYAGLAGGIKKLGIETHFIGPMGRISDMVNGPSRLSHMQAVNVLNKNIVQEVIDLKPDAILLWKGESIFPNTVAQWKKKGIKILYFSWDDPFYISQPKHCVNTLQSCQYMDLAFTSCEDSAAIYRKHGCNNVHLLWPGFDPSIHRPAVFTNVEERKEFESDVSFVATNTYHPRFYPQTTMCRLDAIYALQNAQVGNIALWGYDEHGFGWLNRVYGDPKLRPLYKRYIKFEENNKVYSVSNINLNSHPIWGNKYLNERNFQIMGSGGFMLVDAVTGIDSIFKIGIHCDIYYNLDDLTKKVKHYLANPDLRETIAARGMREVLQNHTWDSRAQVFAEQVKKL
jgi:spore maturation protein CgeB